MANDVKHKCPYCGGPVDKSVREMEPHEILDNNALLIEMLRLESGSENMRDYGSEIEYKKLYRRIDSFQKEALKRMGNTKKGKPS